MTFHSSFSSFSSPKCESLALHPSFFSLGALAPFFSLPPTLTFFLSVFGTVTGHRIGLPWASKRSGFWRVLPKRALCSQVASRRQFLGQVTCIFAHAFPQRPPKPPQLTQLLVHTASWSPSPPLSYHALILFNPSSPHS